MPPYHIPTKVAAQRVSMLQMKQQLRHDSGQPLLSDQDVRAYVRERWGGIVDLTPPFVYDTYNVPVAKAQSVILPLEKIVEEDN